MNQKFAFEEQDGVLAGPVRMPRNSARHLGAGSIHDDATAQKLGFRGGTVAGSLHMEQFPPLLVASLGEDWLRTGGMSLYFKYATTDNEPVQAFARRPRPEDRHIEIWMDDAKGNRVADGTANVGGIDPRAYYQRPPQEPKWSPHIWSPPPWPRSPGCFGTCRVRMRSRRQP